MSGERGRGFRIALQLGIMSILTLVTVAAFTHITTMLLFRRLVIGDPEITISKSLDTSGHPTEDYRIPVKNIPRIPFQERGGSWSERLISGLVTTGEVYLRCFYFKSQRNNILLLCNPSGETVDSISDRVVTLTKAIGFDMLAMFDYRPTGRSSKNLVSPDASTMLEDSESVLQWLINVVGIEENAISVAGISLGGLQAIRLASKHPKISRMLLINTFASFSCLLRSTVSLLPGALRIGRTGAFLPDITGELKNLSTEAVAVVSVEEDERIPNSCTEEMLTALGTSNKISRILHIELRGTHSDPKVDHDSLDTIRDFLKLDA